MIFSESKEQGATLVEILLVMAIASSLLLMSIKMYKSMKLDSSASSVKYNVDQLFEAAAGYYYSNCIVPTDPVTGTTSSSDGALDPTHYSAAPVPNSVTLTVQALQTQGYLTINLLSNDITPSPNTMGYTVQLTLLPITNRTTKISTGATINMGQVINWKILVGVKLPTNMSASIYQKYLGADCLSDISGGALQPCNNAPANGTYAIWERLPSAATPVTQSGYWTTNAYNKEFKQQYTTHSFRYITTAPASSYPVQYFQCND